MKRILLALMLVLTCLTGATAQDTAYTPVSYETITFDATAGGIGFAAATLTVRGSQVKSCAGVLETAQIRYRIDGLAAVTASVGSPLEVGTFIRITNFAALSNFRGIRTGGTSGVIAFTCSR